MRIKNLRRDKFDFLTDTKVDRSSRWGNPFYIGRDGNRSEVIRKYMLWLTERIDADPDILRELRDEDPLALACWCAPEGCHAEVLALALAAYDIGYVDGRYS